MIASAEWKNAGDMSNTAMLFDGRSESGHTIHFDATSAHESGSSPMEAVLAALCGCTAVDVASILQKKREDLTALTVSADAEQAPAPPRVFTKIHLTYHVHGKVSQKAAEDAVALSKNKYCSVSKMLEKAATVDYEIVYPDGEPEA